MDKTPIKVYEDRELLKTPQSGIKRVLNITPANPLSPKDVNVQTPLIFKPKKLQIPDIFSPISKIKSLPVRQKYTTGNNENWEDLETDDEAPCKDAVTSTPIVPKRNRNYYNCLKITPKHDKSNVKIIEKKNSNDKFHNVKYNARKASTNTNDIYSLRRRKMKENLANELKAVLHKKQLKHEIDKKVSPNLLPDNKERSSTNKPTTSDSFEELKARFERVKSKAAKTDDKSPSYNTESAQKDTKKTSAYNFKEILRRQAGNEINNIPATDKNMEEVKTNKPTPVEKSELSELEVSKQESGSNLNYYTAFPDTTNPESSKKAVPPVFNGGHLKYQGHKKFDQNDISGVQIIPNSLNVTPSENNGEGKLSKNNNSRSNKKPLISKTHSLKERNESKIPKLHMEKSSNKKSSSILIRDEDIDRITYKLNLGPVRTLNSTSNEKAKLTGRNAAKVLSQPKKLIEKNVEHEIVEHCEHDPKLKLAFQSPVERKTQEPNEGLKIDDAVTEKMDHLKSVNSCKKVPTDSKTKSEPKRKPCSFKISRQNKTETETYTRSTSSEEVSLSYNARKRKISFTGKNTHSEVHNSKIRVTSQYKVTTCDRKISLQESVNFSRDQFIQKHSTHNFSESVKEFSELYNSQNEISSNYKDSTKPTFPQNENRQVNSTFVIQNPSSCYDCHNSMPIILDHSSPNSIGSSCSSKVVSETKTKSVKTSLGTFGDCFKFRKKSTTYSRETKSNLKRSYSFVHISVKDKKLDPKSILDLHSLSQSFPKNSFYFSDTESSPLLPHENFPKHSQKKRKQLKTLTKDHFQKKSLREEREPVKENEEIYDKIDKNNIESVDFDILKEDQIEETDVIYDEIKNKNIVSVDVHEPKGQLQITKNEAPHRISTQRDEQRDRIESFRVSTDKYDIPNFHNSPSSQAESKVFQKFMKIKSVDIERDSLSDESENCVVLNDEFFKKTQKLVNNEKELIDITKGVAKVEDELNDLSRLHSEIKEDLVIKWACPTTLKSSSSSDNISEGNDSVKHDGEVDDRIPMRNAASADKSVNINKIKTQLLTSKVLGSSFDKQRDRDNFTPADPPPEEVSKAFDAVPKTSRISSPLKSRTDRFQRDEYRLFLEEQNYRAIQMIESRMTRVEEKLSSLQSVTLDIRNLLQAKFDSPAGDSKAQSSPVPPVPPPPPPPLPPPPPPASTEVFFFPLRSSTSYNSSLAGTRRKSSPRNKSLRPAITVDDLRSVTLRKVSKEQKTKLKQTAM